MGIGEGRLQLGRTMTVEQAKQPTGGASEMAAVQCDLFEERLGARARGHQSVSAAMFPGATLVVGEFVEMARLRGDPHRRHVETGRLLATANALPIAS